MGASSAASLTHSALQCYRRHNGSAAAFGWLTAEGIYTGSLVLGLQGPRDAVAYDAELLPCAPTRRT